MEDPKPKDVTEEVVEKVSEQVDNAIFSLHNLMYDFFHGSTLDFYLGISILVAGTIAVAFIALLTTRIIVNSIVYRIVRKTKTKWDDALVEHRMFARLAHLIPASVILYAEDFFPLVWDECVRRFALAYFVFVIVLVIDAILNSVVAIYQKYEVSRSTPIKGFVQGVKIFVFLVGLIFLGSVILNKDPWKLVASVGAVTAVLLLVFKDSILGLVASIQIVVNDLLNIGDWIEMPRYGADGDVIDISLTTIKVRNWDNTITTIPTYGLISDSFKNWRGMQRSGGRRIKRSFQIDLNSISFCDQDLLSRFEKFDLLYEHIQQKRIEITEHNSSKKMIDEELINGRRLTNLGCFRAYLVAYLHNHPQINKNLTLIVRQLAPSAAGVPMEIYVFCRDKKWENYEAIQADIFDHVLAVIPEFNLRLFQNPSGLDFQRLSEEG